MRIAGIILAIAIAADIVFWIVAIAWQRFAVQRTWIADRFVGIPWGFVILAIVSCIIGFGLLIMSTSLVEGPRP